ncbi:hypothetical protein glysoja_033094 [Glycine soja]|uniref:Uncharacterized protein n=1 Tax=Glycine soja TaxID=3848 RepID=A0A0B2PGY1_GLYSO|nr:hypothetical protein glysoja_033094 [Glycine soja]
MEQLSHKKKHPDPWNNRKGRINMCLSKLFGETEDQLWQMMMMHCRSIKANV